MGVRKHFFLNSETETDATKEEGDQDGRQKVREMGGREEGRRNRKQTERTTIKRNEKCEKEEEGGREIRTRSRRGRNE